MGIEQENDADLNDEAETVQGEENLAPDNAGTEADEVIVSIGDPKEDEGEENQQAPAWVKKVRQQNRELQRELREARQKLNQSEVKEPELGEKPKLEGFDYDAGRYETALELWYDNKRKLDEKAAAAKAETEKAGKKWQSKLEAYAQAKAGLGVTDFEEAEAAVYDLLDTTQQGIIVHGAKDSALVIYAIGKNEAVAKRLAAIKDPVEFAFEVARLEGQLKVTTRKPSIQPEQRISGNGRPSGTTDSTLERLRAEAAKSGDYTKVHAYKRLKQA